MKRALIILAGPCACAGLKPEIARNTRIIWENFKIGSGLKT